MTYQALLKQILTDIKVELADEFDRNFERKAFFTEKWQDVKEPVKTGSLMMRSGDLRRSIEARTETDGVRFLSSMPYALLHNEGGTVNVPVTDKMRRFFWAKFKETGIEKYKFMALTKKEKLSITVPKRQFIGHHPEVDKRVNEVTEDNFKEFLQAFNKEIGAK